MIAQQKLRFSLASLTLSLIFLAGSQISIAQNAAATKSAASHPRVFLLDAEMLARLKGAPAIDSRKQEVVTAVIAAADKAMHEGPFSVMQKAVVPPQWRQARLHESGPLFLGRPG
jgi:hypothetical protein